MKNSSRAKPSMLLRNIKFSILIISIKDELKIIVIIENYCKQVMCKNTKRTQTSYLPSQSVAELVELLESGLLSVRAWRLSLTSFMHAYKLRIRDWCASRVCDATGGEGVNAASLSPPPPGRPTPISLWLTTYNDEDRIEKISFYLLLRKSNCFSAN